MDNCHDRSTLFPEALWKALMNLPALRYMKAPVDNVSELYHKYPIGNEKGTFAFVYDENTFYTYHPRGWNRGQWKPVAGGLESFFEVDTDFLKEDDILVYDLKKKKFVVKSGNVWNNLLGDLKGTFSQVTKFVNQVDELPTDKSDSGIYFVHTDENDVEFRALYIVLGKKAVKIFNSFDYKTKLEVDADLAKKANQTQVNDIAASVDVLAVTKADKFIVDALQNGIIKQPGVDTYNDTSDGKISLLSRYPNMAEVNKGWDVLVRNDETKGGKSNRYNWNGTVWVDMETGNYDENVATKDDLIQLGREIQQIQEIVDFGNNPYTFSDLTWTEGYYLDANGTAKPIATFSYGNEFIPVKPFTQYTLQCSGYSIVWYDKDKNVVGSSGNSFDDVAVRTFTSPNNTAFARCNQSNAIKRQFLFVEGGEWKAKKIIIKPNIINLVDLNDKKIYNLDGVKLMGVTFSDLTWTEGYYLDANGTAKPIATFSYGNEFIPVKPFTQYTLQCSGYSIVWYDKDKNVVGSSGNSFDDVAVRTFTSPNNTAFARCNQSNAIKRQFLFVEGGEWKGGIYIENLVLPPVKIENYWKGKNMAWYGTSIPAGYPYQTNQAVYSYANRCAAMLGASIQNYCVPNGCIRKKQHDGSDLWGGRDILSFTNPETSTINYQVNMLDLIGTKDEPDLFVFDYGVNDLDADSWELSQEIDYTSNDVNLFYGAYNFVISQLFAAKPRARIIIITHFSNDGIQPPVWNGKDVWLKMNEIIRGIASFWGIPVINLNNKTGWFNTGTQNNLRLFVPDGIHPATDTTLQAVEILSQLCYEEISKLR